MWMVSPTAERKARGLYHKTYYGCNRLERLAKDKHSSLLRKSVNYGRSKFYDTGSRSSISERSIFLMQHFEANLFMSKFDLINVRPSRSYSKFKNSEELLFRITVSKG